MQSSDFLICLAYMTIDSEIESILLIDFRANALYSSSESIFLKFLNQMH
jgi:hypothetical protein